MFVKARTMGHTYKRLRSYAVFEWAIVGGGGGGGGGGKKQSEPRAFG